MKSVILQKSSFTLPPQEVVRVTRLKEQLNLPSNTALIRLALKTLEERVERSLLREKFKAASRLVSRINAEELESLDALSDEGLDSCR